MPEEKENIAEAFGSLLKELRVEKNFSQERLAEESGLDRSYISLLERGKAQPTLETLFRIALVLKINASTIISNIENRLI